MKLSSGVLGLMALELLRGANSLTSVIPGKYKYLAYCVTLFLGLAVQVLAHLSNPDGSSADVPNGLTDKQLEAFRKDFTEPAKKAAGA